MRVVLDGFPLGPRLTGTGVYLDGLLRALSRDHADLDLTLTAAAGSAAVRAELRATAARVDPSGRLRARPIAIPARLLRPAQRHLRLPPSRLLVGGYDIYHQVHLDADPAVPDRRLVLTVHDLVALDWPGEGRPAPFLPSLLRRAAAIVTVSQATADRVQAEYGVDPARLHVAHNGVDHDRFTPADPASIRAAQERWGGGSPYLLALGGATPRKNLPRILEAFDLARAETGFPGRLVIGGAVPGFIDDADLPSVLAGAEALVYPSLAEGFGLPIIEAMASGTRVITADRGACAEVAGDAATLVDPTDVAAIARGIVTVLTEAPDARASWVAAGVERAAGFSWTKSAAAHVAAWRAVAAAAS